jgi:uncharacterized membrane-anchored protein YhcB (DUF1043 family)
MTTYWTLFIIGTIVNFFIGLLIAHILQRFYKSNNKLTFSKKKKVLFALVWTIVGVILKLT